VSTLDSVRPRHLLSRFARAALIALAVISVAGAINIIGILLCGDVSHWSRWLDSHRGHFWLWRLGVYAVTAYGWRWMRGRVLRREGDVETSRRLRRAEIAAVLAILALEASVLMESR
jgi:hypothetical protein